MSARHVVVETERLVLRPFTETDAPLLIELDGDPEVMRFLNGGLPTPGETVRGIILPRILREYGKPGFGTYAVESRATGEFLGWVSLRFPSDRAETAELGYRFRRAAWGHGFATEACTALLATGFADPGLQRVVANTYEENQASRRVMERLGMRFVRSYRLSADALASTDTFVTAGDAWEGEDVEYEIERDTWLSRNAQRLPDPGD